MKPSDELKPDMEKAIYWLERSAFQGYVKSHLKLAEIFYSEDKSRALKHIEAAYDIARKE